MDYKKIFAIKKANEKRIRTVCDAPVGCGIYILHREEAGIKYAYVGQSIHVLQRLAEHLSGYQAIDLSIKKHGLWSGENPCGYKIKCYSCEKDQLDDLEREYIRKYANAGYQLRNCTTGGQSAGKGDMGNSRQRGTYTEGVAAGYEKARKEVSHWFDLHLNFTTKKKPPTVNQQKAAEKFLTFIKKFD